MEAARHPHICIPQYLRAPVGVPISYLGHELHLHLTPIALSALLAYFARLLLLKKGQINRPTIADINNYNPTFRTHSAGSRSDHIYIYSPIFPPPRLHRPRQPTLVFDSKKPPPARACRGDHNTVDICWSSSVTRSRGWQPRSSASLGH